MRDDRDLLQDMLERIQLTYTFTSEGREAFMASRLIQEGYCATSKLLAKLRVNYQLTNATSIPT